MRNFSLTDDAKSLLARGNRRAAPKTLEDITTVLSDAGFPLFERVVATFYFFGGVTFPIGSDFTFSIYTVNEAVECLVHDKSDNPSEYRIEFGEHSVAPLGFAMDGNGTIYADDGPVSQNVQYWIEHHAMLESVERCRNGCRLILPDQPDSGLQIWANRRFAFMSHVSDLYCQWWRLPNVALNRFVAWGADLNDSRIVWLFTSNDEVEKYASDFEDQFGCPPLECSIYP